MNATEFFKVLGKDQVRLRVIGAKSAKLDWQDDYTQPDDHDVYFVVNDGGDKADDITQCRAFFVEWDDKPIEWQLTAWQELDLPEPTLQVITGNKSVHNYWVLDKPCSVQQWKNIQLRLIDYTGSDPALKDPSRVLRVPGYLHRKTGQPAEVVHTSNSRVTLRDFDALLPLIKKRQITRRITNAEPGTLDEIRAALECIPPRPGGGSNTYQKYRNIIWGLVAACEAVGEPPDTAVQLVEDAGWADINVAHVAAYDATAVGAGTFWFWAYQHGYNRPLRVPKCVGQPGDGRDWLDRLGWVAPEPNKLAKITPLELVVALRALGDAIKWNEMDGSVWIDGEPVEDVDIGLLYINLERCGIKTTKECAIDAITTVAREHMYHPIRDYLDGCTVPLPDEMWGNIVQVLLGGEPTEFDNSMLRKWLISAVARIYCPGAAFGHVHVLSGEGMSGKSRFFQELASDEWFLEGFTPSRFNSRDDLLNMHRQWIIEWGEIDEAISGKGSGQIKNMLSVKSDLIRAPYGRGAENRNRSFVICGTTNHVDGFFQDATGNRRFVVYQVTEPVDFQRVQDLRDSIWATARRDYLDGKIWWPTQEERSHSEKANSQLLGEQLWTNALSDRLDELAVHPGFPAQPYLLPAKVLQYGLDIPLRLQDNEALRRLSLALQALGCSKTRKLINGRMTTIWRLP